MDIGLIEQAVVLAGGKGSRLGNRSRDLPKPLQPVGGRPFVELVLRQLRMNGVRRVVMTVGYLADRIKEALGEGRGLGLDIEYFVESRSLGTGGALGEIAHGLDEVFAVVNGDTLFDVPLSLVGHPVWAGRADACLALRSVPDATRYGTIALDDGLVRLFAEKGRSGPGTINAGVYVMRRSVAASIAGPTSLEHDTFQRLMSFGRLGGVTLSSYFIDIGIPEDLARAQEELPEAMNRPVALLDRDGVINVDHGHVHRIDDFEWVNGAPEAIRLLAEAGYRVAVVTNQAGIAKGEYSETQFRDLTRWMVHELAAKGAPVYAVYYCPHHPQGVVSGLATACACRKPEPGMLLRALDDLMADPVRSFVIGDNPSDLEAAEQAGVAGYRFDGSVALDEFVGRLVK